MYDKTKDWICQFFSCYCLLIHVIAEKIKMEIKVTGRQDRRRKHLLDDLKEEREYWKMKEEILDCAVWRSCFGIGYGSLVRQPTEWVI